MRLTLPYQFDTTGVVKVILRGVLGLLVIVIVPGILYSLFVTQSAAAAIALSVVGAGVAFLGRVFLTHLSGAAGTITAEAVVLQPARLYGLRLWSPSGRFPPARFTAVRVERSFGPIDTAYAPQWHERVWLVGAAGTPDLLIGRTERGAGTELGQDLAQELKLGQGTALARM